MMDLLVPVGAIGAAVAYFQSIALLYRWRHGHWPGSWQ